MKNYSSKALSLILTLFIMSTIVFKQNYIEITYLFNFMLIGGYAFLMVTQRDEELKINHVIVAYALFTIFTFASSFWALNFDLAANRGMKLFLVLINISIIYNVVTKYKLQNAFIKGMLLGSFVNFILVLGIIPAPFQLFEQGRAIGTLGNANSLALAMIMSILSSILYLYKEKEVSKTFFYYQYINIFLSLYMIILTVSKKGILFGSIMILVFLILSIKNLKSLFNLGIMGILIVAIFLNVINLDELQNNITHIVRRFTALGSQLDSGSRFGSTGERLYFIELALNYFMDKPLFGHGIDNFRVYTGRYTHNNYTELLFGVGFIGMTLYYSLYFFIIKKIFNIQNINLKIILALTIINMLIVDIAVVSYGSKLTLYILLFISIVAETNSTNYLKRGVV